MSALTLVRILRAIPHTRAFDRHLTECAALSVLYHPFGGVPFPLTWRMVLRLDPLPPFVPPEAYTENVVRIH